MRTQSVLATSTKERVIISKVTSLRGIKLSEHVVRSHFRTPHERLSAEAWSLKSDAEAPDYCFRIGGTRKFFLDAKKPSVYIKEEIPPAYQLRSYAWSAKLP